VTADNWDALMMVSVFLVVVGLIPLRNLCRYLAPRTPGWKYNLSCFKAWCCKARKYRVCNVYNTDAKIAAKQDEIDQLNKEIERLTYSLQFWMKNPVNIDANKQLVLTFGNSSNGNGHHHNGTGHKANGKQNGNGVVANRKVRNGLVIYEWDTVAYGHEKWGLPLDEYQKREVDHLVKVRRNGKYLWVAEEEATEYELAHETDILAWKKIA
jgi:hypothetical protein